MLFFYLPFLFVVFIKVSEQFNLPKFSPETYSLKKVDADSETNRIHIMVNHLTNSKTTASKDHNMYDFFNKHIHMCKSETGNSRSQENLGSILLGDRIYELPFTQNEVTTFGKDVTCKKICSSIITPEDSKFIDSLIIDEYQYQWFIDDLPVGYREKLQTKGSDETIEYYSNSFDVGYYDNSNEHSDFYQKPLIYNHFDIIIEYSETNTDEYVIVGSTITPLSIKRADYKNNKKTIKNYCSFTGNPKELVLDEETNVDYTISIQYRKVEDVLFDERWNKYLALQKLLISNDWNNLIILLAVNLLFSIAIYNIVFWSMNKYKQQKSIEKTLDMEFDEDQGWKLLLGDIYRQPPNLSLLCTLVGSGVHIMLTCLIIGVLGSVGLLSQGSRGIVLTIAILIFTLLSGVTSFISMKLYLSYGGKLFKKNMVLNCCLVPFVAFGLLLLINLVNIIKLPSHIHSPAVIPLKTLLVFLPMWILVYVPGSLIGSVIAKRFFNDDKSPRKINKIQRLIHPQPFFSKLVFLCVLVSPLPFSSVFLVLKHTFVNDIIVNGIIPKEQFIVICASLLVVAYNCFIMGVIISYFLLILENWKWCWKVYMTLFTGMLLYIFVYGCFVVENYHNFVKYLTLGLLIGMICGSFSFLGGVVCIKRLFSQKSTIKNTVKSDRLE